MTAQATRFNALIIGDEILSGKRADKHFSRLAEILAARGLQLSGVHYLGDERGRLTEFLKSSFASGEALFSFGGIGNTPDDHTRQAAAAALGTDLVLHPEAEVLLRERFGAEVSDVHFLLGTFPRGCDIIPNPFNRIPGFMAREHYFVPGFPQMAHPMVEWVLDTYYAHLFNQTEKVDKALLLTGPNAYESALLDLMERIVADYPDLRLFSLPSMTNEGVRRHLELGVEGAPIRVEEAMGKILAEVERRGIAWTWRP